MNEQTNLSVVHPSSSGSGIGQPVRRKEDFRLVTGSGRYGDDFVLPRMVHAAFVRSPHAHARIRAVEKEAALALPGALAVFTGADYVADGLEPIPHDAGLMGRPDLAVRKRGGPITMPHWPLPPETARFVGEAVAMVVAESVQAARDGAERVAVDYEVLPSVTDTVMATRRFYSKRRARTWWSMGSLATRPQPRRPSPAPPIS